MWIDLFMAFLGRIFGWKSEAVQAPESPDNSETPETTSPPLNPPQIEPQSLPEPSKATLTNLCRAIEIMEGSNPAIHNPGNCRYSQEGYAAIYGHVGKTPAGFAIFKDYATGWLYLQNLIRLKRKNHPNWTLLDLFKNYAPQADDNDPVHYASFVAKRMGVNSDFQLKNLVLV